MKSEIFKIGFEMVWFLKGPNQFQNCTVLNLDVLSGFQMVFVKMVAIYPDLKYLGFWISDPIQNPDYLSTNLFLTI